MILPVRVPDEKKNYEINLSQVLLVINVKRFRLIGTMNLMEVGKRSDVT